jgi:hypothetical protein
LLLATPWKGVFVDHSAFTRACDRYQ